MGVKYNQHVHKPNDREYSYNCWRCERKIAQFEIIHHLLVCNPTYEKQLNKLIKYCDGLGNYVTNEKVYNQCKIRSYKIDYKVADTLLYILRYKNTYNKTFFNNNIFKTYIIGIYCSISDIRAGKRRPRTTALYIMKILDSIKESLININIPIIEEIKNEVIEHNLYLTPAKLEPYDIELLYTESSVNDINIKHEEAEIQHYLNWPTNSLNRRNIR